MSPQELASKIHRDASALTTHTSLFEQLLSSRGLIDQGAREAFLNPSYETGLHDPFLLHDMEPAVKRLLAAIETGEQIAIYSDYDCDGIPGAVIMHDFLKAIGHERFSNHIPHRHYDGFGVSRQGIDACNKKGATLIITIDCGTADHEPIAYANELGIDVIVTDHHEPKATLPEAVAVVNPTIGESYPFTGLCGAAVLFKLVQATIERGRAAGQVDLKPGWEKWWLDMVGIATIADMVPLTDENRVLAHYGLQVLRMSRRPGLQHLLRKARASQRHLSEDDIGFTIGPRINAASRMDTPEDAFYMLAATEEGEAGARVAHLEKLNNERKGLVAAMTKDLHKRLKQLPEVPPVIVLGSAEWRPSLVGLAANKLAEELKRPVFLWGRDGNGVIKGSCRSDGRTSLIALMDAAAEHFLEHGGHHFSGGYSVSDEEIHTLPQALVAAYESLGEAALAPDEGHQADAELALTDLTPAFLDELFTLAPFGIGNEKPLFQFTGISPLAVDIFGKSREHLKLRFNGESSTIEAIAFFAKASDFTAVPKVGEPLTLYAHIERSFFMNRLETRLRIVDIY